MYAYYLRDKVYISIISLQKISKLIDKKKVNPSPYVCFSSIALSADHLWAHPVRCASDRADACSRHTDCLQPFAGPKVPKLHIPSRVTENIGSWTKERRGKKKRKNRDRCFHAIQLLDLQPMKLISNPEIPMLMVWLSTLLSLR